MNTLELKTFLETNEYTRNHFLGIFACDLLPLQKIRKRPALIICNTDEHNKPGQHWIAIYIENEKKIEYFDSFGLYPNNLHINRFIKQNCETLLTNNTMIQGLFSKYCGHFCALFLYSKCLGISMKNFLLIFNHIHLMKNDDTVRKMFSRIYCTKSRSTSSRKKMLLRNIRTMQPICEEMNNNKE